MCYNLIKVKGTNSSGQHHDFSSGRRSGIKESYQNIKTNQPKNNKQNWFVRVSTYSVAQQTTPRLK